MRYWSSGIPGINISDSTLLCSFSVDIQLRHETHMNSLTLLCVECLISVFTKIICIFIVIFGGTRWHSWLRHYATSRKVVFSIHNEVIGYISIDLNPSSCTMGLGSAHPLTEMSTRNLPACKGLPARNADYVTAICEPIG
jgi:hypothetical protein